MKKYMLSLAVLVVAVVAMAFTNVATPAEEVVAVQYQFAGSNMNDVYNTSLWTEVTASPQACPEGNDLPCLVSVEGGTISQWLNSRSEQEILEDAQLLKD